MKRRITKAIRARIAEAQRKGHYAKAASERKKLRMTQALSREVKHG